MYGHFIVYFTTITCLQLIAWTFADTLDHTHNIFCQPLLQVVPVNGNGLPYFVELHQCKGSVDGEHPDKKNCTFKTFNEVKVKVDHTGVQEFVTLKNHTSCKEQCSKACPSNLFNRNEKTCVCTCPHADAPKGHECSKDYTWDSENCDCKCNLKEEDAPSSKKLDKEQCKFVCNRACREGWKLNPETCRCSPGIGPIAVANNEGSDNTQQGKVLAALVIGEFVFLYLIFDFLLYSKKTGLMYYVRCKCRGKPNAESAQAQAETKRCLENGDGANNVPLDVVVDRNGASQLASGSSQHVSST